MMASLLAGLANFGVVLGASLEMLVRAPLGLLPRAQHNAHLAKFGAQLLHHARAKLLTVGDFDRSKSYIVVSNHQSLYDIPVLFCSVGPQLRMVTKKELRAVPFWGRAMEEFDFIFIDRNDRKGSHETLQAATRIFEHGLSLWIAPEGTRSKDGQLGPFKMGAFHLALTSGYPILPVTIAGTRDMLPPGTVLTTLGVPVTVTIHSPIAPKEFGPNSSRSRKALAEAVRQAIQSALP